MKKIVILLIIIILAAFFYYLHLVNTPNSKSDDIINFAVESGWGSDEIAKELKNQELIKNNYAFVVYVWKKKINTRLLSGDYQISKDLNIKEVAQILSGGEVIEKERKITVIEGWTSDDIADYFEQEGIAETDDFIELVGEPGLDYGSVTGPSRYNFEAEYSFLEDKPNNYGIEGYLFPDTYRIYKDAELIDIIRKMLDNFDKKLTGEMIEQIKKNKMDIYKTLTLASIIEKEVSKDEDRKMVASIFYKRLNDNIRLQADSTVNYITKKGVSRSSLEDTKIDNPYNTYKYAGLPPGPICNPSLSSIMAAIYPDKNDYYYFLTTPDGQAIYSKTFDEHKINKAKYLD